MAALKDTYRGATANTLRNGRGSYTFSNAYFTYRGEYRDGKRHGLGSLLFGADGCDGGLTGAWDNGDLVGDVSRTWADGRKYEGPMVGGEMQGRGTLTGNGFEYVGQFHANRKHGPGTERCMDPTTGKVTETFTGTWENGKRHGPGRWIRGEETVEGEWVHGTQNGTATIQTVKRITTSNGGATSNKFAVVTTFTGEATDARPSGMGRLVITTPETIPELDALVEAQADALGDAPASDTTARAAAPSPAEASSADSHPPAADPAPVLLLPTRVVYDGPFEDGTPTMWPTILAASLSSDWQCPPPLLVSQGEEPAAEPKTKTAKKAAKAAGAEEQPQDPIIPAATPCGGGWAHSKEQPLLQFDDLEEWAAYDDIQTALIAAHKAELAHTTLQASASDRWASHREPVIKTRPGCGLPPIQATLLFAAASASSSIHASGDEAAQLAAAAAAAIAEEEATGKKRRAKKKGKDESPALTAPSLLVDNCLPWEALADTTDGIIVEVSFTANNSSSTVAHGHLGRICGTSRHVLKAHGGLIEGIWLPEVTPPGQLSMQLRCRQVVGQPETAMATVCVSVVA